MLNYLKKFIHSSLQTKLFILFLLAFVFSTVVPAAYFYARLDFVRSYKTDTEKSSQGEK